MRNELLNLVKDDISLLIEKSIITKGLDISDIIDHVVAQIEINNAKCKSLFCPHCRKGILYNKGRLEKDAISEEEKKLAEEENIQLGATRDRLKKLDLLSKDISEKSKPLHEGCPKEIQRPVMPDMPLRDINDIKKRINWLNSLTFTKKPRYPEDMQIDDILDQWKMVPTVQHIKRGIEQIGSTLAKISLPLPGPFKTSLTSEIMMNMLRDEKVDLFIVIKEITKLIPVIRRLANDDEAIKTKINVLQKQLNSLLGQQKKIPQCEPLERKIVAIEDKIQNKESMIKIGTQIAELIKQSDKIDDLHAEILRLTAREGSLVTLKGLVNEVYSRSLQDVVDNINNITNTVARTLFEKDVLVKLRLSRELKTKDKIRQQVNIQVDLDSVLYDITEISGGEHTRVSLALTLALSYIGNCPFILLDESTQYLETDAKEILIAAIRKTIPNKTVIIVCPNIIEGLCDEIITLPPKTWPNV